ncbi:MAG: hypothetical protein BWX64_01343 [Acidobacteria bacterium ADurb.Bin051]|nr:MAG: hypothetical protein BWX64_01343 [Acidobacteria bacterium ADurb.Bin051]
MQAADRRTLSLRRRPQPDRGDAGPRRALDRVGRRRPPAHLLRASRPLRQQPPRLLARPARRAAGAGQEEEPAGAARPLRRGGEGRGARGGRPATADRRRDARGSRPRGDRRREPRGAGVQGEPAAHGRTPPRRRAALLRSALGRALRARALAAVPEPLRQGGRPAGDRTASRRARSPRAPRGALLPLPLLPLGAGAPRGLPWHRPPRLRRRARQPAVGQGAPGASRLLRPRRSADSCFPGRRPRPPDPRAPRPPPRSRGEVRKLPAGDETRCPVPARERRLPICRGPFPVGARGSLEVLPRPCHPARGPRRGGRFPRPGGDLQRRRLSGAAPLPAEREPDRALLRLREPPEALPDRFALQVREPRLPQGRPARAVPRRLHAPRPRGAPRSGRPALARDPHPRGDRTVLPRDLRFPRVPRPAGSGDRGEDVRGEADPGRGPGGAGFMAGPAVELAGS